MFGNAFCGVAIREVAAAHGEHVNGGVRRDGPKGVVEWAVLSVFMGRAGARVAAGAVAELGEIFLGWIAVWELFDFGVPLPVFVGAADGVGVDF